VLLTILASALLASAAAVSIGHAIAATASGRASGEAFGASGSLPSNAAELDLLVRNGATEYRTDAQWPTAEPAPPANGVHTYAWASFDAIATTLAEHRLRWFAILDYSPGWASSDGTEFGAPTDRAAFAAYAAAFAARYGVGGSFWASHPQVPALPVAEYEIWNEENIPLFWHQQATAPAQYATLVLAARRSIKAVVPSAHVVLGGVLDGGADGLGFLAAMERAHPGVLRTMDAIGYHPYQGDLQVILERVAALRRLLRQAGASAVPIDITEMDANDHVTSMASWTHAMARLGTTLAASPGCEVSRVFAYMGAPPIGATDADSSGWFTLFGEHGTLDAVGLAYVGSMHRALSYTGAHGTLCAAGVSSSHTHAGGRHA
jgi:hypothetical protein